MKMSQLRAIGYAYARKRDAETAKELDALNLQAVFKFQNVYTTARGFLDGVKKGTNNGKKALTVAADSAVKRLEELARVGCTSYKVDEAKQAKEGAANALEKFFKK